MSNSNIMQAKYIGDSTETLVNDQVYNIQVQNMGGKLYNYDTHEFIKDNRLMVWVNDSFTSVPFYKVYNSEHELYNEFRIV